MSGIGGYLDQQRRRGPSGVGSAAAGVGAAAVRRPSGGPSLGQAINSMGPRRPNAGMGMSGGSLGVGSLSSAGRPLLGRIGAVNYGAISGLQNFIGTAGQAGIDYLRRMGVGGSYNGADMFDAMQGNGPTPQWTPTNSSLTTRAYVSNGSPAGDRAQRGGAYYAANGEYMPAGTPAAGYFNSAFGPGGGAPAGGAPNILAGGAGAGGPGMAGGELDDAVGGRYLDLINSQGGLGDDLIRRNVERGVDTVARGTSNAVEQARIDAARRGVTVSADREARIRQQGASAQAGYRDQAEMGLRQEQANRYLQALAAAGAFSGGRRRDEILLGQLAAQSGMGAGLPMMMNLAA